MVFKVTNIEEQLQKVRNKQQKECAILAEVQSILCQAPTQDDRISAALPLEYPSPTPRFRVDCVGT